MQFVYTLCYTCKADPEKARLFSIFRKKQCRRVKSFSDKEQEIRKMRDGIHPNYYQATVTCNCGNTFVTGSTKEDIHVEVCAKCHPFYTGQQKAAQARGRVEMFNRKYNLNK